MACRFYFFRIKFDQFLACFHMLAFLYEKLKAVSAHIYRIDAYMDQKLDPVGQRQATGMACISHDNTYVAVCRCLYNCAGRFDRKEVSHDLLREHIIRCLCDRHYFSIQDGLQFFYILSSNSCFSHVLFRYCSLCVLRCFSGGRSLFSVAVFTGQSHLSYNESESKGNYDRYCHCKKEDQVVIRLDGQDARKSAYADT